MTDPINMDNIKKASRRIAGGFGAWDPAYVNEVSYLKGLAITVNRDLSNANLSKDEAANLLLTAKTIKQIAPELISSDTQTSIDAQVARANVHLATADDGLNGVQRAFSRGTNVVRVLKREDITTGDIARDNVYNIRNALDAYEKDPSLANYKFLTPIIQELRDDNDVYKRYKDYSQDGLTDTKTYDYDRFNNISSKYGYEKPSTINRIMHPGDSNDLSDGVRAIADPILNTAGKVLGDTVNTVGNTLLDDPKILAITVIGGLIAFKMLVK